MNVEHHIEKQPKPLRLAKSMEAPDLRLKQAREEEFDHPIS